MMCHQTLMNIKKALLIDQYQQDASDCRSSGGQFRKWMDKNKTKPKRDVREERMLTIQRLSDRASVSQTKLQLDDQSACRGTDRHMRSVSRKFDRQTDMLMWN